MRAPTTESSSVKYIYPEGKTNVSATFLIKQAVQFFITVLADTYSCVHPSAVKKGKLFPFLKLRMLQHVPIMCEGKRNF